ncbi:hypothetical protein J6590_101596 [Homalodisca vitripennis]|nr:hypothetical protein J6590_101596 [Homalodisca vitripennis]
MQTQPSSRAIILSQIKKRSLRPEKENEETTLVVLQVLQIYHIMSPRHLPPSCHLLPPHHLLLPFRRLLQPCHLLTPHRLLLPLYHLLQIMILKRQLLIPTLFFIQRHVVRAKNNHVWSASPGTQRSRTPARNIVVIRRKVLGDARQAATPRECFIQLFDEDMGLSMELTHPHMRTRLQNASLQRNFRAMICENLNLRIPPTAHRQPTAGARKYLFLLSISKETNDDLLLQPLSQCKVW